MVDGLTALVSYSPPGPAHDRAYGTWAEIFDDSTGVAYFVMGSDWTLMGSSVDATIAIARSLFRE